LDQTTDEDLLARYVAGEREALEILIRRYRDELLHYLVRFLGSRPAAEDAFQETFLQIHLSGETFDAQRRFKPWLFAIAANKARDSLRRSGRRRAISLSAPADGTDEGAALVDFMAGPSEAIEQPLSDGERRERVRRVVAAMPEHLREILLLGYFHAFTYQQMAEALEIPLGTVKSRLHAAVSSFSRAWKDMLARSGSEGEEHME